MKPYNILLYRNEHYNDFTSAKSLILINSSDKMLADWQMQVSGVMRLDLNTWGFEWTQTKDKITVFSSKGRFWHATSILQYEDKTEVKHVNLETFIPSAFWRNYRK